MLITYQSYIVMTIQDVYRDATYCTSIACNNIAALCDGLPSFCLTDIFIIFYGGFVK